MKTIFKKGDRVFDYRHGWGEIIDTYSDKNDCKEFSDYKIKFYDPDRTYIYSIEGALKTLSFTEYTLQGFSQERPINYEDYVGKWGKFWNEGEKTIVIGKLSEYYGYQTHPFGTKTWDGNVAFYKDFKLLTKKQVKVLGLWKK